MATDDGSVCIIEVMGRAAGWIAAGTVPPNVAPPPTRRTSFCSRKPFATTWTRSLAKVKETVDTYKYCVMVVGEGIKNKAGEEIGADKAQLDAFGHPVLWARPKDQRNYPGQAQHRPGRCCSVMCNARAHCASLTDVNNAFACGEAAVKAAIDGKSGYMVKIVRRDRGQWRGQLDHRPATVERHRQRRTFHSARVDQRRRFPPNEKFVEYARPWSKAKSKFRPRRFAQIHQLGKGGRGETSRARLSGRLILQVSSSHAERRDCFLRRACGDREQGARQPATSRRSVLERR